MDRAEMVRTRRSIQQRGFELLSDDVKEVITKKLFVWNFDPRLREVCHSWAKCGHWKTLLESSVPGLATRGALTGAADWAYCVMNGILKRPALHEAYTAIYKTKFRDKRHRASLMQAVPPLVLRFAAATGARGERGALADKTLAKVLRHVVERKPHNVGAVDAVFDLRRPDLCVLRAKMHAKVQRRIERQANARTHEEFCSACAEAAAQVLEQSVFEDA